MYIKCAWEERYLLVSNISCFIRGMNRRARTQCQRQRQRQKPNGYESVTSEHWSCFTHLFISPLIFSWLANYKRILFCLGIVLCRKHGNFNVYTVFSCLSFAPSIRSRLFLLAHPSRVLLAHAVHFHLSL